MADHRITYGLNPNLYPSFTKGGKRCLRRRGDGKHDAREDIQYTQLVPPGARSWRSAKVYRVVFRTENGNGKGTTTYKTFVAMSDKAVWDALQRIGTRRAKKHMGAAQYAMKLAQQAVSTKGVKDPVRMGELARKVGLANIRVRSFGGDNVWTVQIEDSLAYAAKAFKRADAVEYAMAKAANSIAGMLRKRAKDLLDPSLATPFPEIAKHRRSA